MPRPIVTASAKVPEPSPRSASQAESPTLPPAPTQPFTSSDAFSTRSTTNFAADNADEPLATGAGEGGDAAADERSESVGARRRSGTPLLSVPESWPRLSVDLPQRVSGSSGCKDGEVGEGFVEGLVEGGALSAEVH